ncbi:MAG: membrane protein insertase YidC [Gammaproteobacteria bacterium]|nr:membrane protein insertase YidC [Gammaproteobacteria bacterium]
MANTRLILWLALAALLYVDYGTWMRDYAPPPVTRSAPTASAPSANRDDANFADAVPQATPATASKASAPAAASPVVPTAISPSAPAAAPASSMLTVHTDVFDLRIDLKGGELDRADLVRYPLHKDQPNIPVRLLSREDADDLYVIQTGLSGTGAESVPNHLAPFTSPRDSYTLAAGAEELRVPLTWTDGAGLTVTKTFVFHRGSYAIGVDYDVENKSAAARELASYSQILRHWEIVKRSYFNVATYSFMGPGVYDGSKYQDLKLDTKETAPYSATVTNGWLAALQHHFVSAIVPTAGEPFHYQLLVHDHLFVLRATGPMQTVPAGGSAHFAEKLFVGPKLQSQLAATGPKLQLAVDYGRLTVLAEPLFHVLAWVHGLTGNWGWAIILVTALIKLIFYPLSQASGRSMAKMRNVGPRMKQIQETYKDDREKLGRAMMELYKKEKINPLAGCLPMVVQIPFFISFYWVLLESVEMRQAPFMLWINDLSVRDPYFILPLLMGAAMFAQFKLNPAPPDPTQAKIMQFMPLVMTATMAWFPSGLVLYWITNTGLSILQQWRINQIVQGGSRKRE